MSDGAPWCGMLHAVSPRKTVPAMDIFVTCADHLRMIAKICKEKVAIRTYSYQVRKVVEHSGAFNAQHRRLCVHSLFAFHLFQILTRDNHWELVNLVTPAIFWLGRIGTAFCLSRATWSPSLWARCKVSVMEDLDGSWRQNCDLYPAVYDIFSVVGSVLIVF